MNLCPDLIARCSLTLLESFAFFYYIAMTKEFIMMTLSIRSSKNVKENRSSGSLNLAKNREVTQDKDPYTLTMLALLLLSIGFKALVRLPFDLYILYTTITSDDTSNVFCADKN